MKHLLSDLNWNDLDIDTAVENSYKDFHSKGLDYLCLYRSPELTIKAYFFAEGMDSQEVSEVVNPHDHRYDFDTQCFSGVIRNKWYRFPPSWDGESIGDECGPMYTAFEWRTPLLGGDGFTHIDAVPLEQHRWRSYSPGERYYMHADELHTIEVLAPETCIVLAQYEDRVPVHHPTHTFTREATPPDISGLYNKFTADQAVKQLRLLQDLAGKL